MGRWTEGQVEKTVAVAHLDSAPLWRVLLDMQIWEISSLDLASAITAYVQGHISDTCLMAPGWEVGSK